MTENEPEDYIIDTRSPEMKERIEKEMPLLNQVLDKISTRARELFESTGNMESAIKEAAAEGIKHYIGEQYEGKKE